MPELYSKNRIMPDLPLPLRRRAGGVRRFPQSPRPYQRQGRARSKFRSFAFALFTEPSNPIAPIGQLERTIQRANLTPWRPQRICMFPMPTLVLPFPAINPVLVQWGPLAIRWYALAYIAGLVLGWLLIRRIVSDERYWNGRKRPSADTIDDLLVYCAFGVIIGGRLGNVLFYDPQYYFSHPIEIFKVWEGGMAFHGGLIGALIGVLLFCRRYKAPALTVLDLCSLVAPIGIFLGRIANFIRPELWGRPTDVPWAVVFPGTDGQPRHPSQIYEALLEGAAGVRHPLCAGAKGRAAPSRRPHRRIRDRLRRGAHFQRILSRSRSAP